MKKPPYEGPKPVEPYCKIDECLHYGLHEEAYSCSLDATPPKTSISVSDKQRIIGEQNFLGFWRTALILDFGKDLPALGEKLFKLENEFIADIETAFEISVIQIGEVY